MLFSKISYQQIQWSFSFRDSVRQVVSSSKPREEAGMYWGYKVRYASNLSSVFRECPYKVLCFDSIYQQTTDTLET